MKRRKDKDEKQGAVRRKERKKKENRKERGRKGRKGKSKFNYDGKELRGEQKKKRAGTTRTLFGGLSASPSFDGP
jgi:hypothetical protein